MACPLATRLSLIAGIVLAAVLTLVPPIMADVNCAADIAGCCCRGVRGNVDCDFNDIVDITDLTILIDHLFLSMSPLPSQEEANVDGLEGIDISDVSRLIDHLFLRFGLLPSCPGPVNHPPVTEISGRDSALQPFIDVVFPTATNEGVRVSWTGHDKLDHPYEPRPLRFEWRLYGPYDSALFRSIESQFVKKVFITASRELHVIGSHDTLITCDTVWIPDYPNGPIIDCDTMLVDTVKSTNALGSLDTLLDVTNPLFDQDSTYNRITVMSGTSQDRTVAESSVTLYDFFRLEHNDTTVEKRFIFWVRAHDPDSIELTDPAPPYQSLRVFDAKHEKELLVADLGISYEINSRLLSKATMYWAEAISRWNPATPITYLQVSQPTGNILPAKMLLQHKAVVLLNDDVIRGVLTTPEIRQKVIASMGAGTNFWFCGRSLLAGDEDKPPSPLNTAALGAFGPWLGLSNIATSGWDWYALKDPSVRIEDFVGAEPIISGGWPTLVVDSGYLHARYRWDGYLWFPFIDSLAALPEVTFFDPVPQAELMYTYKSLYTDHHPILPDSLFFAGKPVAYRLDRDAYRLFMSSFTPYAMAGDSVGGAAQVFIDSVLNWLFEPFPEPTVPGPAPRLDRRKSAWNDPLFVDSIPADKAEVK